MDAILESWKELIIIVSEKILDYTIFTSENFTISLRRILMAILCYVIVYFLFKYFGKIVSRKLSRESDKSAVRRFEALWKFVKYLALALTFIWSLKFFGTKLTGLLIGSSALFLGIGLGMQNFFMDFISGIIILVDRSVVIDDVVKVDNLVGRIKRISLRTTAIETRDRRIVVIPNHKVLSDNLYNWTKDTTKTRFKVDVSVAYGSDLEKVKKILLQVAEECSLILKQPEPTVLFSEFGDSGLHFELYFYTDDPFKVPSMSSDLRFMIDKKFRLANITIPFPQRDVHLYNQQEHS